MMILVSKEEKVCYNCKHFWQHYIYNKRHNRFDFCNAGHCVKPRIKNRKPDQKACEYFKQRKEEGNE